MTIAGSIGIFIPQIVSHDNLYLMKEACLPRVKGARLSYCLLNFDPKGSAIVWKMLNVDTDQTQDVILHMIGDDTALTFEVGYSYTLLPRSISAQ